MAEPQTEPEKCKFILENAITEGGSYSFKSQNEARGSSLVESLFEVDEVASVFISGKTITITKKGEDDWRTVGPKIGGAIRKAFSKGGPLISEEYQKSLPDEEEIRKKVLMILNREINPAVAAHGGHIDLLDVKKNDVFIRMGGGCQGCGMANVTLKQGVEQAFRKEIPNLGAIYDTTDHASGMNPYYAPSEK